MSKSFDSNSGPVTHASTIYGSCISQTTIYNGGVSIEVTKSQEKQINSVNTTNNSKYLNDGNVCIFEKTERDAIITTNNTKNYYCCKRNNDTE